MGKQEAQGQQIDVEQSVGGQTSVTRYFVSNRYVEKIFDNLKTDSQQIKAKLESQMEELKEMFKSYTDIREVDLPVYDRKLQVMEAKSENTIRWLRQQKVRREALLLK